MGYGQGFIAGCMYHKGTKVKPKKNCGPLCIFNTFEHAMELKKPFASAFIVQCEYKPSRIKEIYYPTTNALMGKIVVSLRKLPKGTILADSVICLE